MLKVSCYSPKVMKNKFYFILFWDTKIRTLTDCLSYLYSIVFFDGRSWTNNDLKCILYKSTRHYQLLYIFTLSNVSTVDFQSWPVFVLEGCTIWHCITLSLSIIPGPFYIHLCCFQYHNNQNYCWKSAGVFEGKTPSIINRSLKMMKLT